MKHTFRITAFLLGLILSASNAQNSELSCGAKGDLPVEQTTSVKLKITNPIAIERSDELVIVGADKTGGIKIENAIVRKGSQVLPSQPEDLNFDGDYDALSFLIDLSANDTAEVTIEAACGQQEPFSRKTHAEISIRSSLLGKDVSGKKVDGGEFTSLKQFTRTPENKNSDYRFEGPLIESDKIGYRLYWDERGGIDVYGKTGDLFIGDEHTYKKSHHTMQPWGRDILHNGTALGVGALAIGRGDSRFSPSVAPYAKIIIGTDGPIRSSYRMIYKNIKYSGMQCDLTWDISMSASKRYLTHHVRITNDNLVPLMAALTNHTDEAGTSKKMNMDNRDLLGWVGTFGKQVFTDETPELAQKSTEQMGLAMLWNLDDMKNFKKTDLEFRVQFNLTDSVRYYSLAAYNKEKYSPIETDEQFYKYLDTLALLLNNPVIVEPIDKTD